MILDLEIFNIYNNNILNNNFKDLPIIKNKGRFIIIKSKSNLDSRLRDLIKNLEIKLESWFKIITSNYDLLIKINETLFIIILIFNNIIILPLILIILKLLILNKIKKYKWEINHTLMNIRARKRK